MTSRNPGTTQTVSGYYIIIIILPARAAWLVLRMTDYLACCALPAFAAWLALRMTDYLACCALPALAAWLALRMTDYLACCALPALAAWQATLLLLLLLQPSTQQPQPFAQPPSQPLHPTPSQLQSLPAASSWLLFRSGATDQVQGFSFLPEAAWFFYPDYYIIIIIILLLLLLLLLILL